MCFGIRLLQQIPTVCFVFFLQIMQEDLFMQRVWSRNRWQFPGRNMCVHYVGSIFQGNFIWRITVVSIPGNVHLCVISVTEASMWKEIWDPTWPHIIKLLRFYHFNHYRQLNNMIVILQAYGTVLNSKGVITNISSGQTVSAEGQ